jgi:hypothetical protein
MRKPGGADVPPGFLFEVSEGRKKVPRSALRR